VEILRIRPHSPARFFIIGGPIYQTHGSQFSTDELRSLACARNIESHLGFVPFQDYPADVYRALDIVVHASTQPEPFGRTIVEAMACGKPVIVTQAGGAQELCTHDHDALGVPPGNPTALAEAINRLMADPGLRQRLGHNARRTAVERFSRDRLGPQLLDVYRRLSNGAVAA
jgi:glycosyltransferase involved in cell wall biosynthesis